MVGNSILISVNPLKQLNESKFCQLRPFIETITSSLRETELVQSIIISGCSGSGKSECVKTIMNILGTHKNPSNNNGVNTDFTQISTLLEAFGNCKTINNTNCSRFGKFIEIDVNIETGFCMLSGFKTNCFLIDTSRITTQCT